MAIKSSGSLSMTEIVAEFGGSVPHSLSEYYRNGGAVPGNNTNVPTSGAISMGDFYNAVNEIQILISSNTTNYSLSNAFGSNWSTAVPKRLTINSGVTVGSSNTNPAMTIEGSMGGTLIVHNSGSIQGKGGAGSSSGTGGNGYNAVKTDQNGSITFYNNSNGSIYGGGGGGGKGGTGGQGGTGGTGGTGGNGSYQQSVGSVSYSASGVGSYANLQTSHSCPGSVSFGGGTAAPYNYGYTTFCQICRGGHTYATGGSTYNKRIRKGRYTHQGIAHCAGNFTQTGAGGGSGGTGGGGGAGGTGGNGRGYNQSQQNGSAGSGGSGGQAGSGGGNNGNSSGAGGLGGTGGTGGQGGTGGNGGGYGAQGGQGATGNTGDTGNTGNTGSNGNSSNGSGGSGGTSGSGGSGGSGGGSAGYYIQNRHYMTFHNSGSVAGQ